MVKRSRAPWAFNDIAASTPAPVSGAGNELQQFASTPDFIQAARSIANAAASGVTVSNGAIAGIPAYHRAATLAAEAVAELPMRIWKGDELIREKIRDSWQAKLFKGKTGNDFQTWFDLWYYVESSLTYRNRAYIWKTIGPSGRVAALTALHPDQVTPMLVGRTRREVIYEVSFRDWMPTPPEVSERTVRVDGSQILYIPGAAGLGQLFPPTPIELFKTSLGTAIAKQTYESKLFENGVMGGLVVSFPAGTTKEQADQWRTLFDAQHAGVGNTGTTKVTGGGADVKQIGMTQKDAQFVEAYGLTLTDVSQITRVTQSLLGPTPYGAAPIVPEHEQTRWYRYGLGPRLRRIELAIAADPNLFGDGSEDYPAFDTSGVIRGDLAIEAEISLKKVQSGQWLQDEARARDGLPPLPGGVGAIPQNTPVGGAPN